MDLIDTLCNDPQVHLAMDSRPGDIQLLHNHQILHSRGDFENWPEPARHRHLLRPRVAPPEARALPEVFAPRYGGATPGARGGIVVKRTTLRVPLEAE
ncbi:MAG: TauD/TfdA family dioxygenase [Betaproteobacteria bacterium]|nr:TauD/TfdA family dioxygenase [Betaproteobacteria bacterium]MDH5219768.1 TauD/TfdA family dioxygenase [Betaproteobacteria bacterium]MDH5352724.1 TauD/TfdA family dioxygenase [Betaproteobacteria bacterium]